MSSVTEKVYARLPLPAQHAALSGFGYLWRRRRLGGRFEEYRAGFVERERWGVEESRRWQAARLQQLLAIAWTAPGSRERLRRAGINERTLSRATPADLASLPPLRKDEVRKAPESFCPQGRPSRSHLAWHTSGSTGTPLTVWYSRDDSRRALALRDARYRASAGVGYSLPRATFGGRMVEPDPDSRGPYHRYNAAERQVYFSPYHLGPRSVDQYVDALERHGTRWLTGYATTIHLLARLALERGLAIPRLDAVVTTGEPVTSELRADVQTAFGCRVTEEYGLVEQACFAVECERGSLHVWPDAAVVELLDEHDRPCAAGEVGEIVGTGLIREAQPFIRYRTGDLAAWRESCGCGRETPVFDKIEGRVDDVIVTPDGRRVTRLSTVPQGLPGVAAMQIVQESNDLLNVNVLADGDVPFDVANEIRRRLQVRLGTGMEIDVNRVAELERTPRGKVRLVISRASQPAAKPGA